jgi:uncharacterized protein YeaO (DUF488 family)
MTKRITADRVKLKRAYEPAAADDGTRRLVDRLARQGPITLGFSAHDELHNVAVVLRDFLLGRITNRKGEATHR